MRTSILMHNWSIKRALDQLQGNPLKAQGRILLVMLIFSMFKCLVVMGFCFADNQEAQLVRVSILLFLYLVMVKVFLSRPMLFRHITHVMIWIGLLLIWSNFLFFVSSPTIPILQFALTIVICSFYVLDSKFGMIYSTISLLPIIAASLLPSSRFIAATNPLPEMAVNLVVVLNLFTIVFLHYFIFKAYKQNLAEKEMLNKELEQHAEEATRLAAARTAFASTMSHELRTPLYSVIGITELLLKEVKEESQLGNLNILRYSASDLLSLVNNILDINKLDSQKTELEHTAFNLYELVRNVCSVLDLKAKEKQLHVHLSVDDTLRAMEVTSDPTRLTQVMYNLVGNAIKFTEEGSVNIQLQLVSQTEREAVIDFRVSDTGIGIAPEKLQHIFEPFAQASKDTKRIYGGTGLGLTIVKEILSLFHAEIEVKSKPGEGSTFRFQLTLPLSEADVKGNINADSDMDLAGLRILVAEDNQVNQLILQKQLEALHLTATMVNNGKEALELLYQRDFDAVLLDLDMPEINGYETVARIHERRKVQKSTAHLIAFTASVSNQQQILSAGFDDYLYKPVELKALRQSLERAKNKL